jgi:hypothetical protein
VRSDDPTTPDRCQPPLQLPDLAEQIGMFVSMIALGRRHVKPDLVRKKLAKAGLAGQRKRYAALKLAKAILVGLASEGWSGLGVTMRARGGTARGGFRIGPGGRRMLLDMANRAHARCQRAPDGRAMLLDAFDEVHVAHYQPRVVEVDPAGGLRRLAIDRISAETLGGALHRRGIVTATVGDRVRDLLLANADGDDDDDEDEPATAARRTLKT